MDCSVDGTQLVGCKTVSGGNRPYKWCSERADRAGEKGCRNRGKTEKNREQLQASKVQRERKQQSSTKTSMKESQKGDITQRVTERGERKKNWQ